MVRSKRIRIYPSKEQKKLFKNWLDAARYVYNLTVEYLRIPGTRAAWKDIKLDLLCALPDWCREIPFQIKSIAIRDACKAVSNAKIKFKITGVFNEVGFRSRKDLEQSCFIPKSAVKRGGLYHTYSGAVDFTEEVPRGHLDSRLRLINGRYFVCVPHRKTTEKAESQGRVAGLDPGVRTFLTWFGEGSCGKIGAQAMTPIYRLCHHLDELTSKISKATGRQKRQMRRAASRIRWRIVNLIDELHHKAALFLCRNFDIILLPTFETKDMVDKLKRRIGNKTARGMLTLAHFRFKKHLKCKALELGKVVIDVNEAYTSKTASWTGEVKPNLGAARTIRSGGITMDRDENGARGIVLRALVDQPALRACIA